MKKEREPMDQNSKKPYSSPKLTVYGSIEKITGWIGGPWGEFLGGEGDGWNPWDNPGPQGS